jgi:general secretion pathway protein A
MYQAHFGLDQEPFSIAPDPAFLFLSDVHNEALAHLMYGFSHGGFVLITGEVGTGKTTLLRNLLDRTPPELDVAFILNPRLTVRELLETLCDELGVVYPKEELQSVKQYIDVLNKHLLKTHQASRSTVVIIDEAQNLSPAVLEQIRLLTNLETNDKKLLRIILLGQPELADMLARTELRQLAQRITARYHLTPLSRADVGAYVGHRLTRAGGNPAIFSTGAIRALYRLSKGTPRLINVIADRAMLGAYVEGKYQVTAKLVRTGAREVLGTKRIFSTTYLAAATTAVLVVGALMLWAYTTKPAPEIAASPSTSTIAGARAPDEPQAVNKSRPVTATPATSRQPSPAARAPQEAAPTEQASRATTRENRVRQPTRPASTAIAADVSRPAGRTYVNRRKAYRAVFAAWGADYDVDAQLIPCDFAPRAGLQCLSRKGGWSEIKALDSPAVLELQDDEITPYYAALLDSDGDRHRIQLGDRTLNVSPADLRDVWFGAYVLLWQTPPKYAGSLREGDDHPTVKWLHQHLLEVQPGLDLAAPQTYFDRQLHNAVIDFQRTEGLLADGIVGPLTWIRLSDRLDLPAPKLGG